MQDSTRFTWVILILSALLLGTLWIFHTREQTVARLADSRGEPPPAPVAGYRAPDFELSTLGGERFVLSEQQGRPVILNFWATWCPPCRIEIPFFEHASNSYGNQVVIVGVNSGESVEQVASFVGGARMSYLIPLDEEGQVSRMYRANALPITYFVDANGTIRSVHIGVISQGLLETQIEQLIHGG